MSMKKALILIWILALLALISNGVAQLSRYPVGQPVPASVYTEPFDPCDPAYKFLQPPPKDWAEKFGYSERTMLIHAISELRAVVAQQGKRLMALESGLKDVDWDRLPRKTVTIESSPVSSNDSNEAKR